MAKNNQVFTLTNCKSCKITIQKSREEHFNLKPEIVPHWDAFSTVRYDSMDAERNDIYILDHYLIPMTLDFFFLGLLLRIELKRWVQSKGSKYLKIK